MTSTDGMPPTRPGFDLGRWATKFQQGAIGVAIVLVAVLAASLGSHWLDALAVLGLVGAATAVVGAFVGLLFVIPRAGETTTAGTYLPNTSLQQISDWLTKIIVGVGLIQARAIGDAARGLFRTVSVQIDGTTSHSAAVGGLLVYMLVVGFLVGFLKARRFLPEIFEGAEDTALVPVRRVKGSDPSTNGNIARS